jgi:hypothetical protein
MNKVRNHHAQAKVILITGLADPKVRKEVAEAGADAFFIKPVPVADFLDAVERHLGLVRTLLPFEPIDDLEEEERAQLPDLLVGLRKQLNAKTAILLSDRGRILARAGDLPDNSIEISLLAALMAIFSAGQKVSHLLKRGDLSSWHVFNGGEYDMVFSPVGSVHGMLVVGKDIASENRILETVGIFSDVRAAIEASLSSVSAKPADKRMDKAINDEESTAAEPENVELLFKKTKKKLKPEEMDSFWRDAAEKQKSVSSDPDVISYDQARQLGLTPKKDK